MSGRQILRSTAILTVADLIQRGGSFVVLVLVARKLDKSGLGIYSAALAGYAVVRAASSMGVRNYLVREIARNPDEASRYVVHLMILSSGVGVIVAGGAFAVLPYLGYSRELHLSMSVVLAAILPGLLNTLIRAVFVAYQRVFPIGVLVLVFALINIGVSVTLLSAGSPVYFLVAALVLGQFAVMLIGLVMVHRSVLALSWGFDWNFLKRVLSEVKAFAGLSFVSALFAQPEILLLSVMASEDELGEFSAAFKLMAFWLAIPTMLMTNVFPHLARAQVADRARVERLFRASVKHLLVVSLPIVVGLAFASDLIIRTIYGPGFAGSATSLSILAVIVVLNALDHVYYRMLTVRDQQGRELVIRILSVVVRLTAGAVLIRSSGQVGAAVAAVVGVSAATVLMAMAARRGGSQLELIRLGGRTAVAAALMGVVVLLLASRASLVLVVTAAAVSYVAFVMLLGVYSRAERDQLRALFRSPLGA